MTRVFSLIEQDWIEGTPYRVVRPLGLGGMGEVYEVDHTRTGTRRAIKVLRLGLNPRGETASRFLAEARVLWRIDHPNVVRVYEAGRLQDGRPYYAMQLLEGVTLRALISREGPVPAGRAVRLFVQALEGLQAVHDQGLVHRDVKPTNLFVGHDGLVKLLDFGVAKRIAATTTAVRTATGLVPGTARYMAPEQLRGGQVDHRSDLYSAALVLFELLYGSHPFDRQSSGSRNARPIFPDPAPTLATCRAHATKNPLLSVLLCALSPRPDERPPTASRFAAALRNAMGTAAMGPVPRTMSSQAITQVEELETAGLGSSCALAPSLASHSPEKEAPRDENLPRIVAGAVGSTRPRLPSVPADHASIVSALLAIMAIFVSLAALMVAFWAAAPAANALFSSHADHGTTLAPCRRATVGGRTFSR